MIRNNLDSPDRRQASKPHRRMSFAVKPLSETTWPAFADLVERHNGVWGGCWCLEFHPEGKQRGSHRRSAKEERVRQGTAHASLVFDGAVCVGWCQFGAPDELPRIKHLRIYSQGLEALPDWRITCFFVDAKYRGQGVGSAALAGALEQIAWLGGGTVESYPEDVSGRTVSASFLYNARLSMFEQCGFTKTRQLGKNHWVMAKVVAPAVPQT
jgi:GNAT superfamily N-acetyltransferase